MNPYLLDLNTNVEFSCFFEMMMQKYSPRNPTYNTSNLITFNSVCNF